MIHTAKRNRMSKGKSKAISIVRKHIREKETSESLTGTNNLSDVRPNGRIVEAGERPKRSESDVRSKITAGDANNFLQEDEQSNDCHMEGAVVDQTAKVDTPMRLSMTM